jgi:hypothetical protein
MLSLRGRIKDVQHAEAAKEMPQAVIGKLFGVPPSGLVRSGVVMPLPLR